MRDRLEILKRLLRRDGSIWISIDDNEYPYLRVLCDEIFGRANFVCTIIWEKRKTRENRRVFSFKHDYVVVYAIERIAFEEIRNPVPITQDVMDRYRNLDDDPRGPWQSVAITAQAGHGTKSQFYEIITPGGRKIKPPAGTSSAAASCFLILACSRCEIEFSAPAIANVDDASSLRSTNVINDRWLAGSA
jgi:adenine-specific DNA-methyltransferase